MKNFFRLIIIVLMLSSISLVVACSTDSGDGASEDRDVVRLMKKAPNNWEFFTYMNLKALRTIHDTSPEFLEDETFATDISDEFGIESTDIDFLFFGGEGDLGAILVQGRFNLNDTRKALIANEDYRMTSDYRDVEIWEDSDDGWTALMDDCIIGGEPTDVRMCIRVILGEQESLYDEVSFNELIEQLPDGFSITCGESSYLFADIPAENMGVTMRLADANMLEIVAVAEFEDADVAQAGMSEFEAYAVDSTGYSTQIVDVSQNGKFIKVTMSGDFEDVVEEMAVEEATYAAETERQNVQLALTACMAHGDGTYAVSEVIPQTIWKDDTSIQICHECTSRLTDYLEDKYTTYYYQWDLDGKVYQCKDRNCPDPFERQPEAVRLEKQDIQLALTACMAHGNGIYAVSEVIPQTTWTDNMTLEICDKCKRMIDYLDAGKTRYFYQWDETGTVYQCEDKSCPDPF